MRMTSTVEIMTHAVSALSTVSAGAAAVITVCAGSFMGAKPVVSTVAVTGSASAKPVPASSRNNIKMFDKCFIFNPFA